MLLNNYKVRPPLKKIKESTASIQTVSSKHGADFIFSFHKKELSKIKTWVNARRMLKTQGV